MQTETMPAIEAPDEMNPVITRMTIIHCRANRAADPDSVASPVNEQHWSCVSGEWDTAPIPLWLDCGIWETAIALDFGDMITVCRNEGLAEIVTNQQKLGKTLHHAAPCSAIGDGSYAIHYANIR